MNDHEAWESDTQDGREHRRKKLLAEAKKERRSSLEKLLRVCQVTTDPDVARAHAQHEHAVKVHDLLERLGGGDNE